MDKNFLKHIGIICLAVFAVTVSFFAGLYVDAQKASLEESITAVYNKNLGKPNNVDFSTFWSVWSILDKKFVDTHASSTKDLKSDDELTQERVYGAIRGMVDALDDPYTTFFTPEENEEFETELSGSLEGVGMEVGMRDDAITVITPLAGSPAERAGILAGDKIVQIDDTVTIDMDVSQAVGLMRGKSGTKVKLTLIRQGKDEPIVVNIVRERITVPIIETENLSADKTFVIKIHSFSANSPELFRSALREFVATKYRRLIIDVRNNPGGYLEAAVDIASWFLPSGEVIVTEDYGANQNPDVFKSYGYDIFNENLKLAILVNQGSASASEILAGALSEYGKGVVVGEKTFGKGSVQELISVGDDAALKITIAEWLTPKGNSISDAGLTPKYEVSMTESDYVNKTDSQLKKAIEVLK